MKVKESIELIEGDGWEWVRTTGSHRHYKHRIKKGIVTVPGKMSDDLPIGTQLSILKQAGLK
jgi:predicted RNA binding protein YcfA (HicA-like mRNA interferase family)